LAVVKHRVILFYNKMGYLCLLVICVHQQGEWLWAGASCTNDVCMHSMATQQS
jgi:hypothetical protein